MQTDTVGPAIFFLDTKPDSSTQNNYSAEVTEYRSMFRDAISETYGPEVGGLLTNRIDTLLYQGGRDSRPVIIATVSTGLFRVATVRHDAPPEVVSFSIPHDCDPLEAGEMMQNVIELVVVTSDGITDMIVNQILCQASDNPLSMLLNPLLGPFDEDG